MDMNLGFGSSLGASKDAPNSVRRIPTFFGAQSGRLTISINSFTPDIYRIEIIFASEINGGTQSFLIDGDGAPRRLFVHFRTDGTIDYNQNIVDFATLDGSSITPQVTSVPSDGKVHKIELTTNGTVTGKFRHIGQDINLTNKFKGSLLSIKVTNLSNPEIVAHYVFDSGSTTTQEARGGLDNDCVLTAFTLPNWSRYTLRRNIVHDIGTIEEAWVSDNLVVNGTFDADTDWTLGTGWSIAGGELVGAIATGSVEQVLVTNLITSNVRMLVSFEISNYSAGGVELEVGSGGESTGNKNANGAYSVVVETSSAVDNTLSIKPDVNFSGSIDNVSVQHLLEIVQ